MGASMESRDPKITGNSEQRRGAFFRAVFSTGHKSIGLRFLWLALFSVVVGMTLSLAMRMQLSYQAAGSLANTSSPERYVAITLLRFADGVFCSYGCAAMRIWIFSLAIADWRARNGFSAVEWNFFLDDDGVARGNSFFCSDFSRKRRDAMASKCDLLFRRDVARFAQHLRDHH